MGATTTRLNAIPPAIPYERATSVGVSLRNVDAAAIPEASRRKAARNRDPAIRLTEVALPGLAVLLVPMVRPYTRNPPALTSPNPELRLKQGFANALPAPATGNFFSQRENYSALAVPRSSTNILSPNRIEPQCN
jgi:hypothetical protein